MNGRTTCPYCGVGCGVQAELVGGRLRSVRGDAQHPANRGRLCVKGSALHETVGSDGRLLQPMVGGRPSGWDDALQQVAEGLQRTIREHGPGSVAFYLSGQLLTEDYYVANKLMKGFIGSANVDTNSRLCMSSAVAGYKRAFGSDSVPGNYEDLELAELLVLVGSNAAWSHPILFQRMQAAKQRNPDLKIVVIDPRRTATCEFADLHLQLKPATDTLLFNGLLAWLAEHDGLDLDYLARATEGAAGAIQAARRTAGRLAQVAAACDLAPAQLKQFYDWFLQTEKTVTFYSQGVNQSASGVDNSNAIINCHLATGRIGQPGAGPFSVTGQPNAMGGREVGGLANQLACHMDFDNPADIDRVRRFWGAPNMAQRSGLKVVDMFQAMEQGEIKAVWIMATNPVVSMPDADQVRRALAKCPLVIVSDCNARTDTTGYADILLPATGWSEKDGTVTNSERRISRQRGLLPPKGEARHDWQIVSQVARRMGFAEAFAYEAPHQIFAEYAALSGFENSGRRVFDISALADIKAEGYAALAPLQWPVTAATPLGTARLFGDGRFPTPSGRARLVAIEPRPARQQPDAETPLIMNTGRIRDQWHTMTRTGQVARLWQHRPEPFVELHPADAAARKVGEGQLVSLDNRRGRFVGRARLTENQRRGELFVPMHWSGMYSAAGRMGSLIAPATDPLAGQPESKHGVVQLNAFAERWQALLISGRDAAPACDYWSRTPLAHSSAYHLAGRAAVTDWQQWCREQLSPPELWLEDRASGQFRAAGLRGGRLDWVLLVLPYEQLPDTTWLDGLFARQALTAEERRYLLSGRHCQAEDKGSIVCSCFQVGSKAIEQAIAEGCDSVAALGEALACGSNCGSCIPELEALLKAR